MPQVGHRLNLQFDQCCHCHKLIMQSCFGQHVQLKTFAQIADGRHLKKEVGCRKLLSFFADQAVPGKPTQA